jgi:hypothetical protein
MLAPAADTAWCRHAPHTYKQTPSAHPEFEHCCDVLIAVNRRAAAAAACRRSSGRMNWVPMTWCRPLGLTQALRSLLRSGLLDCGRGRDENPRPGLGRIRCERFCEPNAVKRAERHEMRRDRVDRLRCLTCTFETCTDPCNSHRLAHNPEVAGSNPVPATSKNGPRKSVRGPFSCPMGTLLGTFATLRMRWDRGRRVDATLSRTRRHRLRQPRLCARHCAPALRRLPSTRRLCRLAR